MCIRDRIPPGPAQGAKGIVTGMLLAADRAFDQLPRTGNVEGGGVHVCWFRLHRHMFFRLREKVGAEKGQSSTGGAAVYIHLNPVGDGGKKARQSQAPARLPEVHLPPALGATHRLSLIHIFPIPPTGSTADDRRANCFRILNIL